MRSALGCLPVQQKCVRYMRRGTRTRLAMVTSGLITPKLTSTPRPSARSASTKPVAAAASKQNWVTCHNVTASNRGPSVS